MNEAQRMVLEFHRQFDIHVAESPTLPDAHTEALRLRLIQEEFDELKEAFQTKDLPSIAKELADLLYVVYGTAVSCGIDMEPVFREVQRSNMSKIGGHKREDGKWVKPSTYSPADIAPLLRAMEPHAERKQDEQKERSTGENAMSDASMHPIPDTRSACDSPSR